MHRSRESCRVRSANRFAKRTLRAAIDALEPRLLLANVSVNEILAVNVNGLTDENGDHSDWIELRNSSASPQSLNGFFLTDDPTNLNKWQFPDVSIPANGYLLIFASDKNRAIAGSPLHTNFHLNHDGETVSLVNPDGATVESQLTFGQQEEDISFGPDPGSAGNPLRYFAQPTPLAANVRSEVVINEIHFEPPATADGELRVRRDFTIPVRLPSISPPPTSRPESATRSPPALPWALENTWCWLRIPTSSRPNLNQRPSDNFQANCPTTARP